MVFFCHDGDVHDDDHRLAQGQNLAEVGCLIGGYLPLGIVHTEQDQITQIQNLCGGLDSGIKIAVGNVAGHIMIAAYAKPGLLRFGELLVQNGEIGMADLVADITGHDEGISGVGQRQQTGKMVFWSFHLCRVMGLFVVDSKPGPSGKPGFVLQRLNYSVRIVGMIQMNIADVVKDLFCNAFYRNLIIMENNAGGEIHNATSYCIRSLRTRDRCPRYLEPLPFLLREHNKRLHRRAEPFRK